MGNVSSYQKGIRKIMGHKSDFEMLISEYLLSVNSKYKSNMFPTPQIAKVLVSKLKVKKTKFPIIHKIVRMILKEWCDNGWCEFVSTTRSGKNRKNKYVYKFSPENFKFLKGKFITGSINEIEMSGKEGKEKSHHDNTPNIGEIEGDIPIKDAMKSREIIFEDWIFEIQDLINDVDI